MKGADRGRRAFVAGKEWLPVLGFRHGDRKQTSHFGTLSTVSSTRASATLWRSKELPPLTWRAEREHGSEENSAPTKFVSAR